MLQRLSALFLCGAQPFDSVPTHHDVSADKGLRPQAVSSAVIIPPSVLAETTVASTGSAELLSPEAPSCPSTSANVKNDFDLVLGDGAVAGAGNCGAMVTCDMPTSGELDSLLASLLNSMAARQLTTCTSLETFMEGADGALLVRTTSTTRADVAAPTVPTAATPVTGIISRPHRYLQQQSGEPGSNTAASGDQEGHSSASSSPPQPAASQAPAAAPAAAPPAAAPPAEARAAAAETPLAAGAVAHCCCLPESPPPASEAMSPFKAVSAPFLDAGMQPDDACRDGGLEPLLQLCAHPAHLLGASHSCTLPGGRNTAAMSGPEGVCIGALSGEEPLQRPCPPSRPRPPISTSGSLGAGVEGTSAAGAGVAGAGAAAAPAAAVPEAAAKVMGAAAPSAASGRGAAPAAMMATGMAASNEANQQGPAAAHDDGGAQLQQHGSGPQVVTSLAEVLADLDGLSPMATTAAALGPAAAAAAAAVAAPRSAGAGAGVVVYGGSVTGGRGALHTCWQGTWQGQQAVVVKVVAGSGGSGWCGPDAALLGVACRGARLAAAHPNLARVLAVRALVLDPALLQELQLLLRPAAVTTGAAALRPLGSASLSYAAWAQQAGGQREAGLVLGAPGGLPSGILHVGGSGSAAATGAASVAAGAAAAAAGAPGVVRPVGRLQRFLMNSPLGVPELLLSPAAAGAGMYLQPARPGVYGPRPEDSACLNPAQIPDGAAPAAVAASLPRQQHQPPNPQLLPLLRALARLKLPPGGCVVAVVTEMCDMGNLATLACAAESPFRPSRTWPVHVAHRALLRTAREIAAALAALHAADVPHGCLTPSNVLIQSSDADRRGFVARVADAGSPALSDAAANPLASVTPRMLLLPPEALMTAGGGAGTPSTYTAAASNSNGGPAAAGASSSSVPVGSSTQQQQQQQQQQQRPKMARPPAFAADVFSFGMLLYVMASGRLPYADEHLVPALVGIAMDGRRPEWPTSACGLPLHAHLEPLYRDCVAVDPLKRPSAQQVLLRIRQLEAKVKAAKEAKRTGSATQQ